MVSTVHLSSCHAVTQTQALSPPPPWVLKGRSSVLSLPELRRLGRYFWKRKRERKRKENQRTKSNKIHYQPVGCPLAETQSAFDRQRETVVARTHTHPSIPLLTPRRTSLQTVIDLSLSPLSSFVCLFCFCTLRPSTLYSPTSSAYRE